MSLIHHTLEQEGGAQAGVPCGQDLGFWVQCRLGPEKLISRVLSQLCLGTHTPPRPSSIRGWRSACGGLNENGPYRPIVSGILGGVVLLEEVPGGGL